MKKIIFLSIMVIFSLASCTNTSENGQSNESESELNFVHTVFFWLNDTVSEAERLAFESGLEILGTTPSIGKFHYGKPAGTPREVVDNSYDYALILHFANAEDQDEYQEDETHLEFIDKYQHLWEFVKVYDTILE